MKVTIVSVGNRVLKKRRIFIGAVGLIFLTVIAFWVESKEIPQHIYIFYWPFVASILFWVRCIPFPLALIGIIIWTTENKGHLRKSKYYILFSSIMILLCGGLFFQYVQTLGASSIHHIGTAQFESNTYHIAAVHQYDERSEYFLGKCDNTGYWCKFHKIFIVNAINSKVEVGFDATSERLSLKFYGKEVYKYDGVQEFCIENSAGFCAVE